MTSTYPQARELMARLVEVANEDGDDVAHGFIEFCGSFFNYGDSECWIAKFTHKTVQFSDAETIKEVGDDPLELVRQIVGATRWAGRVL